MIPVLGCAKKRRRYETWLSLASGLAVGVLAVGALLISPDKPAYGKAEPAKSADSFVDSVGVNTHMAYFGTTYDRQAILKEKLGAASIRHARDGAYLSSNRDYNDAVYGRYKDFHSSIGMRFGLIVDPHTENLGSVDPTKIDKIRALGGDSLEAFEGPNEYDLNGGNDWASVLKGYQQSLYKAVKDSSSSELPVVGPSLTSREAYEAVGDLSSSVDRSNIHHYWSGRHPGTGGWGADGYGSTSWSLENARMMSSSNPVVATESGYHNAVCSTSGHVGVPESVSAKYIPRNLLAHFDAGIERTYLYEAIDRGTDRCHLEHNFGLLRSDGTEKPAYEALKNLIGLLEDPGPAFEPGSLDYSLGGDTQDLRHALFHKRNGKFYLVLWQEVSSYDPNLKREIPVPERRVTLTLGQPITQAVTYLPNRSANPSASHDEPTQLELDVPDHPLVVELTPSTSPPSNTAPVIESVEPVGTIANSKPRISATVRDAETDLTQSNITLYLDGRLAKTFSYNRETDRLSYTSRRLKRGSHTVKVVARDAQGLSKTYVWSFNIRRR
jgi:hypothetical protein